MNVCTSFGTPAATQMLVAFDNIQMKACVTHHVTSRLLRQRSYSNSDPRADALLGRLTNWLGKTLT